MDVFRQRLEQEYHANILCTAPTVPFRVTFRNGKEINIRNPADFPDGPELSLVKSIEEPYVLATIVAPDEYLGGILELCNVRRFLDTCFLKTFFLTKNYVYAFILVSPG
jgi:translation elongation factor EF-4